MDDLTNKANIALKFAADRLVNADAYVSGLLRSATIPDLVPNELWRMTFPSIDGITPGPSLLLEPGWIADTSPDDISAKFIEEVNKAISRSEMPPDRQGPGAFGRM